MEYRYYRELKHNYLIVKDESDGQEKMASYQARILEKGKLSGFIPCNMRVINNENYLYYEINSMQSLHDRFAVRGMDCDQLRHLLEALKDSLESLSEYLLGMENVILDARSVFTDLSTGKFKFMYCPFKQEQADFAGFIEELIELVDHDDESAVEMIYSCSEKAQMESMLALDCIEQVLGTENYEDYSDRHQEKECNTQDFIDFGDYNPEQDYEECQPEQEPNDKREEKKWGAKIQLIFGVLFMGLLVAMMYIRMNYILSKEENILSIIVIVLSMISGLVAIITGIRDARKTKQGKGNNKNSKKADKFKELEDHDYDHEFSMEKTYPVSRSEDTFADMECYKKPLIVTSHSRKPSYQKTSAQSCGETMVLAQDDDFDKDITLYSRNTEKTVRIMLDKFPLTVGKMEGCVDKVIKDASISRIHCRFLKDENGRILLKDLNSTNGTFRNGLKLNPQEEICIEKGDEVRIGRICFDCR